MPKPSEVEVARAVQQLKPGLPVMLISGYISKGMQLAARRAGVCHIIVKSRAMEDLCATVEQVPREAAAGPMRSHGKG